MFQKLNLHFSQVGWLGTTALMMKTQIGLGVLSMPLVFATVGLIPGNILLVVMAGITTWSDYMVGVIKLHHPDVYGIDDVGRILFGRIGYELFGAAYAICKSVLSEDDVPSNVLQISLSLLDQPC